MKTDDRIKITSLKEGREKVDQLKHERQEILRKMQGASGDQWEQLEEQDWRAIQQIRDIQRQMAGLVDIKRPKL